MQIGRRSIIGKKEFEGRKIITDGNKPVLQKRMDLWGFQPLASP